MMASVKCALLLLLLIVACSDACMRVTPGTPGIPAKCQKCAKSLISITTDGAGAKPFESDTPSVVNGCSVRTLVCSGVGLNPKVELNGEFNVGEDGVDMVTIALTCNSAGTAWVYEGVIITKMECASNTVPLPPCQTCTKDLTELLMLGAGWKLFDSDNIVPDVNGCAERTLVCSGTEANVQAFYPDGDSSLGVTTVVMQCNAAGDAWEYMGEPVIGLECASADLPPCQKCADALITQMDVGGPMFSDTTKYDTGCSVRTFVCSGTGAMITANTGALPGTTVAVTCNAAGTAWELNGATITSLTCAGGTTPCQTCAQTLITKVETGGVGAIPFAMDTTPVPAPGACAVRTFVCEGPNAGILINVADANIKDMGLGMVTVAATCNAAGTAWEYMGIPVTRITCSAADLKCQLCTDELIMKSGAQAFTSDTPSMNADGCRVRTLTCNGLNANIKVNGGAVAGVLDQCTGTATIAVTCNGVGTGWEYMGMPVSQLECVFVEPTAPACQQCSLCDLLITTAGAGGKPFTSDTTVIAGGCAQRTLGCTGLGASIAINGPGMGELMAESIVIACNPAGDGYDWDFMGTPIPITQLECSSAP